MVKRNKDSGRGRQECLDGFDRGRVVVRAMVSCGVPWQAVFRERQLKQQMRAYEAVGLVHDTGCILDGKRMPRRVKK